MANLDDQIGQLFIIGLQGKELTTEESDFIVKNNIGGVVLFDRNVESPQQIHKLCTEIQGLRHKQASQAPLFIGIDMEGGRVHRLKPPFTQWPALKTLGDINSTSTGFKFALAMGEELKAVGINLDFAPCVDILTNPDNKVIGDRALGTDAEHVALIASSLVRGYVKSGIIPCAKHYPGHGNTLLDSHEDLPVEDVDLQTLENRELIPFKKSFRARLDMVMTAHIKFPKIDPEWPVTLSKVFIDHLRNELRYKNLIISDDLDMKALRNNYSVSEIPVRALVAGCDILLYCNEPASPPEGLDAVKKAIADNKLDIGQLNQSLSRVSDLKKKKLSQALPGDLQEATRIIGHPDHIKLAKAIVDGDIPEDLKKS